MTILDQLLKKYRTAHFSLIDPDKQEPEEAGKRAGICENYGTNAIMIGGSTVRDRKSVYDTVKAIKKDTDVPVILFPNSSSALSMYYQYM